MFQSDIVLKYLVLNGTNGGEAEVFKTRRKNGNESFFFAFVKNDAAGKKGLMFLCELPSPLKNERQSVSAD